MANEIKAKYSSAAALTITVDSLASSTSGVGRQSTMVDNSTDKFQRIHVFGKIRLGTSPTTNRGVYLHALRGDAHGTPYRTDGAGTTDAGLTIVNADLIDIGFVPSGAGTGYDVYLDGYIEHPGPTWGVALHHDTGVNLDSDAGDHFLHWVGENPEVQ